MGGVWSPFRSVRPLGAPCSLPLPPRELSFIFGRSKRRGSSGPSCLSCPSTMHSSTVLFRFTILAVIALVATADYDDNSVYPVGGIPVAVDLDYFSNYVKKGGPQGPLRFGKRRGPSGPLRFGKRSAPAPEDVVPWYQ